MTGNPSATRGSRRSDGKSLQRTLAWWFSLIALISCVVVGALGTYLRAQGMREMLLRQLETMRDDKTRAINSWFAEKRADLTRGCEGSDRNVELVAGRLGIDSGKAAEIVRLACGTGDGR